MIRCKNITETSVSTAKFKYKHAIEGLVFFEGHCGMRPQQESCD